MPHGVPCDGQTRSRLLCGAPVLITPARRLGRVPSFTQDGVAPLPGEWQLVQLALKPGVAVPPFPRIAETWENTTVDDTLTVICRVDVPGNALLTVSKTLHDPAFVMVNDVVCPAAGVEQPAVPAPFGRLQVNVSGAAPVALPFKVMLLVATPLILGDGPLLMFPPTVKPIDDAAKVKFALATLWPGAAAMTMKLSTVLDAMFDAVSCTVYWPPMALIGTLSVAGVAHDLVVLRVADPSSVAPAGPLTCQKHVTGPPVLVLASEIEPLRGFPENESCEVPVAGVKLADMGFSPTTIVR